MLWWVRNMLLLCGNHFSLSTCVRGQNDVGPNDVPKPSRARQRTCDALRFVFVRARAPSSLWSGDSDFRWLSRAPPTIDCVCYSATYKQKVSCLRARDVTKVRGWVRFRMDLWMISANIKKNAMNSSFKYNDFVHFLLICELTIW